MARRAGEAAPGATQRRRSCPSSEPLSSATAFVRRHRLRPATCTTSPGITVTTAVRPVTAANRSSNSAADRARDCSMSAASDRPSPSSLRGMSVTAAAILLVLFSAVPAVARGASQHAENAVSGDEPARAVVERRTLRRGFALADRHDRRRRCRVRALSAPPRCLNKNAAGSLPPRSNF